MPGKMRKVREYTAEDKLQGKSETRDLTHMKHGSVNDYTTNIQSSCFLNKNLSSDTNIQINATCQISYDILFTYSLNY